MHSGTARQRTTAAGGDADHGRATSLRETLGQAPKNWGRWGGDDEIGALNHIGAADVLRGAAEIVRGAVYTLGLPLGDERGEPLLPGRHESRRYNSQDRGSYLAGKRQQLAGGLEFADDVMIMNLQGTTHVDALAHTWYDNEAYNAIPVDTTIGALARGSVQPLGTRGIVGRGVLLDVARHRGVDALASNEGFTLAELLEVAQRQATRILPHDILIVRTGWLARFYTEGAASFYAQPYNEPGLIYEDAVAEWFHETEIAAWGTDTLANELGVQPETGQTAETLHAALMRNLGVVFIEMLALEELAAACAAEARWTFMFTCAPLRIGGATASPVNPVAIL